MPLQTRMRFVTFQRGHSYAEAGALLGGEVISLSRAGFDGLPGVIAEGADARDRVIRWIGKPTSGDVSRATDVKLRAPLPRPSKIVCAGLTWAEPRRADSEPPTAPVVFSKLSCAVVGPANAIVLPPRCEEPRCEAHIAAVIGRRCRNVPPERWRDYVFGYTILNNVTARAFVGQSCETFAPMGPWIVTADEIEDPQALEITLTLNGELLSRGTTGRLVCNLPEFVAQLSEVCTLEPGDVISSGIAAGTGFTRTPPRFLQRGDLAVIQIEGIGELRNPVT